VRRFLFAPIKAKQARKENVPQAKPVLRRSAPPLLAEVMQCFNILLFYYLE
jgi:hypothetical protein